MKGISELLFARDLYDWKELFMVLSCSVLEFFKHVLEDQNLLIRFTGLNECKTLSWM
jgi:hypothetical protein